jgi:hypothetical protein
MKRLLLTTALFAFMLAPIARAAEITPEELIDRANAATASTGSIHQIEMTVTNKRGDTQTQKMIARSRTLKGDRPAKVTTFLYPEETRGTKFLVIENKAGEDEMKIYIPDLRRVRTISSTQRNQNYMGTDFSYGDIEGLDPKIGQHSITGSASVDGHDCWVLATILDPKKGLGYSKLVNWFRKDIFVSVKTEFYDKDGALLKVKTVQDLAQEGKTWVARTITMKNVQTVHQTVIRIVKAEQKPVDDLYFTDQFLQQTDRM